MEGETYYFMLSLVLALCAAFGLLNLLLLKKGKTILGIVLKQGTTAYQKGTRLASSLNTLIATILTLIFISNLIYAAARISRLDNYSPSLLFFLTAFVLLLFALIFPSIRKQSRQIYEFGQQRKK